MNNQFTQTVKRPKFLLVITAIIALIAVIVLISFGNFKTTRQQLSTTSPESDQELLPQVVLKDYRNSKYGFSFKYTENWELTESGRNPILGSIAAFGFSFKNKLPEATLAAGPSLPTLVVFVFERSTSLDSFINNLIASNENVSIKNCPVQKKNCKFLVEESGFSVQGPFPIQVVLQGTNYTFGFQLRDQNNQLAAFDKIPQPLGAVLRNFQTE